MNDEAAWPNAAHVKAVGAETVSGKTEASHTRKLLNPRTHRCSSTTDPKLSVVALIEESSPPMAQVPHQ
jgi:hypothetical protein